MDWHLLLIIAATAAGSYLLTAAARRAAPRIGLVDRPDGGRKRHGAAMPVMGGVAMFLAIASATLLVYGLQWLEPAASRLAIHPALLISSTLMCGLGVCDDRRALRPRAKLLGQIAACLPFALFANSITAIHFLGIDVRLGWLSLPFTLFWLVACANVINLADGLDGLAGSICFIAAATIAALAGWYGRADACVFALIVAGSIFGFLVHNWPPAKIFMGDAGSLTLGFLIGALAIESSLKQAAGFMLAVPLVLISIPVFDTAMAIVRRKLSGRGIGEADRGHIHHRLQDRGLSRTQALLALVAMCSTMALVTIVSVFFESELIAIAACAATLCGLIVARIFGDHEVSLAWRHLEAVGTLIADSSGVFRSRILLARLHAADSPRWQQHWERLCQRVGEMGGESVELVCHRADGGEPRTELAWHTETVDADVVSRWQFQFSAVRDAGVTVSVVAGGSGDGATNRQRLDDLFRWFETLCRHWPLEPLNGAAPVSSPISISLDQAREIPAETDQRQRRAA